MWRVKKVQRDDYHALREILKRKDTITVIEWAGRLPSTLRRYITLTIRFRVTGRTSRRISVEWLPASPQAQRGERQSER